MKRPRGFTIVELLIVIVVIAILAVVTLVTFNGVQIRAENTKTVQAVNAYVKALKIYAGRTGAYPASSAYPYVYPCFGNATATCGVYPNPQTCWSVSSAIGQANFVSDLTTGSNAPLTSMPQVSSQSMVCNSAGAKASGAFYYSAGPSMNIYFFLRGNADCGSPTGITFTKQTAYDTTYCFANVGLPG